MNHYPHLTASFTRPASATQYTAGDHVANSGTGSAVVPMEFSLGDYRSGYLTGAKCAVAPASGNFVVTAADFDLLVFRCVTGIPFAAGSFPADNAALTLTEAIYKELIGVFSFVNTAWRNPLGAATTSTAHFQAVAPSGRTRYPFNLGAHGSKLIGVVQAIGAWNPGNVAQSFTFTLDAEQPQ